VLVRLTLAFAFAAGAFASPATPASPVALKATLTGGYLHTTSQGSGTATITLNATKVCWKFAYRGLDKPNDSGIHIAPPPAPGVHSPSVVPFTATTSLSPGCVPLARWGPRALAYAPKIVADPGRFYVIIATSKYPKGAIGGVLHTA
jgi:CHRD domain-containing protein